MSYISLYRKYRSQDFNSIVGQQHIVRTLQNAIAQDRIAHAYIFSGPRGTGKTSLARIFAKALNCKAADNGHPCTKCDICQSIASGRSIDVIEIDAASNRGIDEIRSLREQVNYMPVEGRYKVYIIDEVHMLTKEAFNALLKTLEEPPAHALFVLATTEIHKIPVTIISRCQRLDFHRIDTNQIYGHLKAICAQESITADDKTLRHIAVLSEGGMRDALSLLDQLISFKSNDIVHADLLTLIGTSGSTFFQQLVKSLLANDEVQVFSLINEVVSKGADITQFCKDLLSYLRDILMIKLTVAGAVDSTDDEKIILTELSQELTLQYLYHTIDILMKALNDSKWSNSPRIVFELAFLDIMRTKQDSPANISKNDVQPIAVATAVSAQASKSVAPAQDVKANIDNLRKKAKELKTDTNQVVENKVANSARVDNKQTIPENTTIGVDTQKKIPEDTVSVEKENLDNELDQKPVAENTIIEENNQDEVVAPAGSSLVDIKQAWTEIKNKIFAKRIAVGILIGEAEVHSVSENKLTLLFKDNYSLQRDKLLEIADNRQVLEQAIKDVVGKYFTVDALLYKELELDHPALSEGKAVDDKVSLLAKSFGGEIIK